MQGQAFLVSGMVGYKRLHACLARVVVGSEALDRALEGGDQEVGASSDAQREKVDVGPAARRVSDKETPAPRAVTARLGDVVDKRSADSDVGGSMYRVAKQIVVGPGSHVSTIAHPADAPP